jgi:hypothetical protein
VLEKDLRELFAARVDRAPAVDDPAGRAIRSARTIQRRRTAGSCVAAALVLAVALGGLAQLRESAGAGHRVSGGDTLPPPRETVAPDPAPSEARAMARRAPWSRPADPGVRRLGLDLRVGHEVWTVNGERYPLTGVGLVTRMYRVPLGWIYGGEEHVRLLRPRGASIDLVSFASGWLVSPDGSRLAYVRGRHLSVRRIVENGLAPGPSVTVPAGTRPVAFAGDQVIVSGGKGGPFDSLRPERPYRPTWNRTVAAVFAGGTEAATGLVRDGRGDRLCLARLMPGPDGLAAVARGGCGLGLPTATTAAVAPGGAWLAVRSAAETRLVQIKLALSGADNAARRCPSGVDGAAWVDNETVLVPGDGAVLRCRTDGTAHTLSLPDGVTANWALVPALAPERVGP